MPPLPEPAPRSPEFVDRAADRATLSRLIRQVLIEKARDVLDGSEMLGLAPIVSLPSFLASFRRRWGERQFDRPVPLADEIRFALRGPGGLASEGVLSVVPRRVVAPLIDRSRDPGALLWVIVHRGWGQ